MCALALTCVLQDVVGMLRSWNGSSLGGHSWQDVVGVLWSWNGSIILLAKVRVGTGWHRIKVRTTVELRSGL